MRGYASREGPREMLKARWRRARPGRAAPGCSTSLKMRSSRLRRPERSGATMPMGPEARRSSRARVQRAAASISASLSLNPTRTARPRWRSGAGSSGSTVLPHLCSASIRLCCCGVNSSKPASKTWRGTRRPPPAKRCARKSGSSAPGSQPSSSERCRKRVDQSRNAAVSWEPCQSAAAASSFQECSRFQASSALAAVAGIWRRYCECGDSSTMPSQSACSCEGLNDSNGCSLPAA